MHNSTEFSYNELNHPPDSRSVAGSKIFEIKKSLRDLIFSSKRSSNFWPTICRFLIQRFFIQKRQPKFWREHQTLSPSSVYFMDYDTCYHCIATRVNYTKFNVEYNTKQWILYQVCLKLHRSLFYRNRSSIVSTNRLTN